MLLRFPGAVNLDTWGPQAAKDVSAYQDNLADVFNRIERFFQRLDIYTGITPTPGMMDVIVEIMVEVINILAITTKGVKSGRLSELISLIFTILDSHLFLERWLKKLMGNSDIEDSLKNLDKLTQEEARMAQAEQLKVTHSINENVTKVDKKVEGLDETAKGIVGEVRNARSDVLYVVSKVEGVKESVHAVHDDVKAVGSSMQIVGSDIKVTSSKVRDIDNKLDQVNRS